MTEVNSEKATLWDVRAAAKSADGIRIGNLEVTSDHPLLMEPFQEMADDITGWFDPRQGWHVIGVNWGLINLKRIEQSITPDSVARLIAKRQEPDQFTPVFHFDAENPPMTRGWFGRQKELNFPHVFDPKFEDRVHGSGADRWQIYSADVSPDKIGSVYPLEQALKELSSPYYLVGTTVSVNQRNIGSYLFAPEEKRKQMKLEPATSLAVMVFMRDLPDYTRLEVNRLRRLQRQMDKLLPKLQPVQKTQETA